MDALAHYRSQAATTAGPAQLVLMLFDGALSAVARARAADGRPGDVHRELLKAQDIVAHLAGTLDHQRGGAMASNLVSLYDYCSRQLVEANVRKDLSLLEDVEPVLRGVRDAWEESCCSVSLAS